VPHPLRLAAGDLVRRRGEWFEVTPLAAGTARAPGAVDLVLPGERLRLRARPAAAARLAAVPPIVRALDVTVLHGVILEPLLGLRAEDLEFTHDDAEAGAAVEAGRAAAAFLLNPPGMAAVREVCFAGETMPEKSTYFHPKLASGLVLHLVGPPWV
jgi:uncharacterized protein (DUF1015 family)